MSILGDLSDLSHSFVMGDRYKLVGRATIYTVTDILYESILVGVGDLGETNTVTADRAVKVFNFLATGRHAYIPNEKKETVVAQTIVPVINVNEEFFDLSQTKVMTEAQKAAQPVTSTFTYIEYD